MHPEVSAIREANTIPDGPSEKAKLKECAVDYNIPLDEALGDAELDSEKMLREGDSTLLELIVKYREIEHEIMEILRNA
jgi:hypothetical protein